jgi:hypothetical protein
VAAFKIACTDLNGNDEPSGQEAWPFEPPREGDWLASFSRKLIKPQKGASQLIFEYSIIVDGATEADPAIIIDKKYLRASARNARQPRKSRPAASLD